MLAYKNKRNNLVPIKSHLDRTEILPIFGTENHLNKNNNIRSNSKNKLTHISKDKTNTSIQKDNPEQLKLNEGNLNTNP
jgi:hypothetical protein